MFGPNPTPCMNEGGHKSAVDGSGGVDPRTKVLLGAIVGAVISFIAGLIVAQYFTWR